MIPWAGQGHAAALWTNTQGHPSPAEAHAPVPGTGVPQGHSRPSHLAPSQGCCAKPADGGEDRPPAAPTCSTVSALPAAWEPRTAARLSRRAPHVPEPGLLHPVLFARPEIRQLRNRGPSSCTSTHLPWFSRTGLPRCRSPQLPRLSKLTDALENVLEIPLALSR